jgi:hypothetical protein
VNAVLRKLLATASEPAERIAARQAWVRETATALRAAQRAMDDRCDAAVGRLSEEAFARLFDEEQAKVKAFLLPLRAAAERDVWPRELYWGGI